MTATLIHLLYKRNYYKPEFIQKSCPNSNHNFLNNTLHSKEISCIEELKFFALRICNFLFKKNRCIFFLKKKSFWMRKILKLRFLWSKKELSFLKKIISNTITFRLSIFFYNMNTKHFFSHFLRNWTEDSRYLYIFSIISRKKKLTQQFFFEKMLLVEQNKRLIVMNVMQSEVGQKWNFLNINLKKNYKKMPSLIIILTLN